MLLVARHKMADWQQLSRSPKGIPTRTKPKQPAQPSRQTRQGGRPAPEGEGAPGHDATPHGKGVRLQAFPAAHHMRRGRLRRPSATRSPSAQWKGARESAALGLELLKGPSTRASSSPGGGLRDGGEGEPTSASGPELGVCCSVFSAFSGSEGALVLRGGLRDWQHKRV